MDYNNKSNGMHKRRYIKKNKNNKKKDPYYSHRSLVSGSKLLRLLHKTDLNDYVKKNQLSAFSCIDNFEHNYIPAFKKNETTYTWWDCIPHKPKVY